MISQHNLHTSTYVLEPGGAQVINASGEFLRILSAPGRLSVSFDANPEFEIGAAQSVRLRDNQKYERIRIRNLEASTQAFTVVYGDGDYTDDRVTLSGITQVSDAQAAAAIKSAPLIDVRAATFFSTVAAQTFITDAQNTHGVHFHYVQFAADGGETMALQKNGRTILLCQPNTAFTLENLVFQPNQSFATSIFSSSGATASFNCAYTLLNAGSVI